MATTVGYEDIYGKEDHTNGTYHLYSTTDQVKTYQPVRQNNFRVKAYFPDGMLKPSKITWDSGNYFGADEAQEIIDFSVVSFSAPHFQQQAVDVKRGNSTIHFAGVPTFNQGSLVINDFWTADGKSVLMAWQRRSYDVINDTIPRADKYKIKMQVYEYLPDNTLIRSWTLHGCWVSNISGDDWSNENGGKKTITGTIVYDRAEIDELNVEESYI